MFESADFSDLPSFKAAHAQNAEAATGVTVFVAPQGCVGGVDVRGGAPATRETDLLRPENMIERIHAIVIGGGSAFGLEASCGVMEALADHRIGFELAGQCVPIVCGACLFDLPIGEPVWPDREMGRHACESALMHEGAPLGCGSVGAGCGATVGKMGLPTQAMKSGFGWAGMRLGDIVVLACVAVNALGNVMDENGSYIAGTRGSDGAVTNPFEAAMAARAAQAHAESTAGGVTNTTLGVVLTNACLTKAQATKVSQVTHDAYARCIKPVHTLSDGDVVFTMASDEVPAQTDLVGMLATEAMERAIRTAVRSTGDAYGLVGAKDCAKA